MEDENRSMTSDIDESITVIILEEAFPRKVSDWL